MIPKLIVDDLVGFGMNAVAIERLLLLQLVFLMGLFALLIDAADRGRQA